jgi:hypothetical protein
MYSIFEVSRTREGHLEGGHYLPFQSNSIRWNVIRRECHRYRGKVSDEYGEVRKTRIPQ